MFFLLAPALSVRCFGPNALNPTIESRAPELTFPLFRPRTRCGLFFSYPSILDFHPLPIASSKLELLRRSAWSDGARLAGGTGVLLSEFAEHCWATVSAWKNERMRFR